MVSILFVVLIINSHFTVIEGKCGGLGRSILTAFDGNISTGMGQYAENTQCEWQIQAPNNSSKIVLTFNSGFVTECTYDFLFIFDGDSHSSPLVASLSGNISITDVVVARSGKMLLMLYSDLHYTLDGFSATYRIQDCTLDCSNRGTCSDNVCVCESGYVGEWCQALACPNGCSSPNGECDVDNNICECSEGFVGESCILDVSSNDGWASHYLVSSSIYNEFEGRTGHAGQFHQDSNSLWIFGGFNLYSALDSMVYYNFTSSKWRTISFDSNSIIPDARYGHTMTLFNEMLIAFGGSLTNGTLLNDLWQFSILSQQWTLLDDGMYSSAPPPTIDHSAVLVNTTLYIFGGVTSTSYGINNMFTYDLTGQSGWQEVVPRGGLMHDVGVTGHSCVYHQDSNSLIVFGGLRKVHPKNSTRTNDIYLFHLDKLYWHKLDLDVESSPRERAFHTANIVGNYMVIYGGYSHDHIIDTNAGDPDAEVCYSNDMLLFHLGCYRWVLWDDIIEDFSPNTHFTIKDGRFGHVASVRDDSILLVAGGYRGTVLKDLIAVKMPGSVASNPEDGVSQCFRHLSQDTCIVDPDCGWCVTNETCTAYNNGTNCTDFKAATCPGICSRLTSCESCMVWGQGSENDACGWCVQESTCNNVNELSGICAGTDTETPTPWWGSAGLLLESFDQCRMLDKPPGITWIQYRHPVNESHPDEVSILPSTSALFHLRNVSDGYVTGKAVFCGTIHPLGASDRNGNDVNVWLATSYATSSLYVSTDDTDANKELVAAVNAQAFVEVEADRDSGDAVLPMLPSDGKYYVRLEVDQHVPIQSWMKITWDGYLESMYMSSEIQAQFLQPFYSSSCDGYFTCLACLSDASCGWCSDSDRCLLRNDTSSQCSTQTSTSAYLITNFEYCEACSTNANCFDCLSSSFCEWLPDAVRCLRRGRFQNSLIDRDQCPSLCHLRANCSSCITATDECIWCENTDLCIPYGAYTSIYKYGQCLNWYSREQQCPGCTDFNTCSTCLDSFQCGWCGNENNPTLGNCHSGDYSGPSSNIPCEYLVAIDYNVTSSEPADWSYANCPLVEECRLGLDNCQANASCIDTDESFYCECFQGFKGDGVLECNKTCFYDCDYGYCSGPPDYDCICDIGWTDVNCSVNCGCNNHSTCVNGTGICDGCQDWTMGEYCELCVPGSYGDATTQFGCHGCACNGHGDLDMDQCDNSTGVCFCVESTQGDYCEECVDGYYGDPRNGGKCYLECQENLVITNLRSSTLGSHEGDGAASRAQTYCNWILTVFDDLVNPSPLTPVPTITLYIEEISLLCGRDYVYVYDGLPSFISNSSTFSSIHLASFCEANTLEKQTVVQALSGIMTVMFEADTSRSAPSSGFKAIFTVNDCPSDCDGNRECVDAACVCRNGFAGTNCDLELCPLNCSHSRDQGVCEKDLGLCVCASGFGGEDCAEDLSAGHVVWTSLFDPDTQAPSAGDLFPPGVMGHSMVFSEAGDSLVLFGGYSFTLDAAVNSLWKYNLTSLSWSEIINDQVSKPHARHFHAAAYMSDLLYILGGIGDSGVLSDFWTYDIKENVWTEQEDALPLAGHTLTVVDDELFLIGGYSPENGFLDRLRVYDIPAGEWEWRSSQGTPPIGLYGHSTVYHEDTSALYVFGGYRFSLDLVYASSKLYTLRPSESTWSILPIESSKSPFSHVFHSAVSMGDYMLVMGGASEVHNISSTLIAYSYQCNVWFDLTQNNFTIGRSPLPASSTVAVATNASTAYVYGGYSGVTSGALYSLHMPDDLCAIYDDDVNGCVQVPGCSACVTNATTCKCASTDRISCSGPFDLLVAGDVTCYDHVVNRDCLHSESCIECLAIFPAYVSADQTCQWCMNCTESTCVKQNKNCPRAKTCQLNNPVVRFIESTSNCIVCEASECEVCTQNGCMWTRQYQRTGELTYILHTEPTSTWNCFQESLRAYVPPHFLFQSAPPDTCPTRCYEHQDCSSCLDSSGGDGGWKECLWSKWLNKCLSPTYMILRCASGECGAIISKDSDRCPIPCHMYTVCADCISNPGCGWCSVADADGIGVCMDGGLFAPTGGVCQGTTISLSSGQLPAYMSNYTDISGTNWSFLECVPENECLNGHNDCGPTQQCNDTQEAYICTCRYGYEPSTSAPDTCIPVCTPSCDHGTCILPNVCDCEFGYVGGDCSVECHCNGHSECSGPDEIGVNDCLQCLHNTMGSNCEYCETLFVGDPRDGNLCTNCTDYCHGNSHICLTEQEYNSTVTAGWTLTPELVLDTFSWGPVENAVCVNCTGYSSGSSCETCIDGYFKADGNCRACECNGHWSTCNKETGLDCKCDNNTRTPQCPDSLLQEPCYQHQCSKCNERYVGEPTDEHQCYLEMRVEQDYCFWTQTQCPINSAPLPYGRSSFYAVQPKFKNLDIRMTIDVTYGKLDVYVAFNHSIFTIDVNATTGVHTVTIDDNIQYEKESYRRRRDINSNVYEYYEVTASGLNTFLTVETSQFIVVVFDVQNRLVITFPYLHHPLETGKFFVTLLGNSSERENTTQGIMYFHQDQLHIDLFVFFSVFLACFFLLLAFCVIVWQAKSGFEHRRDHQERLIQMESMASRPFGKVMILLDKEFDDNEHAARTMLLQKSKDDGPPPLSRREEYNFQPGMMTSEMVDDGMASIGTLIFTLPGGDIPARACLGSALLTVKQYPSSIHIKGLPAPQTHAVSQKVITAEQPQHCNARQLPRQVWQST